MVEAADLDVKGPSPLARGKPKHGSKDRAGLGTIPARAGETSHENINLRAIGDHPRSRGGNGISAMASRSGLGPSPLARGKRVCSGCVGLGLRTIPARAGETVRECEIGIQRGDHPRSRGGNLLITCSWKAASGPSPLARGKRCHDRNTPGLPGTIPARAGETTCNSVPLELRGDHPRSRGGNMGQ